jgi:hypothetical protein
VDHAVAVKDDPTEVMEPAEEVLSALVVATRFLDRSSTAEQSMRFIPNRARDIVTEETEKLRGCRTYMAGLAAKHAAAVSASAVEWQTTRMSCDW